MASNQPMALEDGPEALGPNQAKASPPLPPALRSEQNSKARAPNETPGPLQSGQEIYRIECEGAVKIQQRDRLAVGQKALYLAKSEPRRLILTGDARIWEAGNSVTGHQVIYYLDQNRSQVESRQNQRVRAFYDDGSGQ
jgi:lipopolysaccharide export system protein LptA